MGIADRLAQLALFSHFRPPELAALAACCVGRAYSSGAAVLRQGETTSDAYLLDRAGIDIQRATPYGLFTLAQLGPGQLFGEASKRPVKYLFTQRLEQAMISSEKR